jgi:hypothetical protein
MDKMVKVTTPAIEVTKVDARAAGATCAGGRPLGDQDGCEDRAAADAVDPAGAAHRGGQGDQGGSRDEPDLPGRAVRLGGPGERQPQPEREQGRCDDEVEDVRAGQQFDADD